MNLATVSSEHHLIFISCSDHHYPKSGVHYVLVVTITNHFLQCRSQLYGLIDLIFVCQHLSTRYSTKRRSQTPDHLDELLSRRTPRLRSIAMTSFSARVKRLALHVIALTFSSCTLRIIHQQLYQRSLVVW